MPEPSLSIIIPTCGRETLGRTITSIREQLSTYEDEIIVVGDGVQLVARGILSLLIGAFIISSMAQQIIMVMNNETLGWTKRPGIFMVCRRRRHYRAGSIEHHPY